MNLSQNQQEVIIKMRDEDLQIEHRVEASGRKSSSSYHYKKGNELLETVQQNTVSSLVREKILVVVDESAPVLYKLNNKKRTLIDAL